MVFDSPLNTNDQSIDRVLSSGLPVMLVFLDGPAPATISDSMNRLASEHAGKLLIAQIRIKDNPQTARQFNVQLSPTVVDILKGQEAARQDRPSSSDLEKHALFLLARGSKPISAPSSSTNPQETGSSRNTGAAASSGTAGTGVPKVITDRTFDQEVLHSRVPVLVDFWAPWCGPCRMTEPAVERLAREHPGKLLVAKVNVDENPALSQRYGVMSIPMMMVVKNGTIVDRWVGALPEPNLRGRVMAVLSQA
jgi:thioredoxin 1